MKTAEDHPRPHLMSDNNHTDPNNALKLPELQQAILEPAILEQLFHDLEHCTDIIEVIPKFRRQAQVAPANITLQQAAALLDTREARAVQVRYRYQNADWCDTLMVTPEGIRLVRIRQDDLDF
jgi:hypothetical protein